jgi:PD-(D/E)XK endonuclease
VACREHATLLAHAPEILGGMCAATVSYLFDFPDPVTQSENSSILRRDTKGIGDRSEAAVLAALVRHGYLVSIPFGENQRYDLIADDGKRLLRIQVKTGRLRDGSVFFRSCSTHQHRRRGPTASRAYFGEIDFLAVSCPGNGKVYLLPESELKRTGGHLRLAPTANRQGRNIRWASRYELP